MKPRKQDETDAKYISRLEQQNDGLKRRNAELGRWQSALNEAVTILSTEASLAFQVMAEKAGVRAHPSVKATLELFNTISHPQWRSQETPMPKIEFPEDWDLDDGSAWSGDGDMALNSKIAEVIETIETMKWKNGRQHDLLERVADDLQAVCRHGIEGFKDAAGFRPVEVAVPSGHFREMSADDLRDVVNAMGWIALDLAQDLHFANFALRRDLRAATYRRVCGDLYALSQLATSPGSAPQKIDIKVFGAEEESY